MMTVDTLIMLSGAFVALLPFLGFPSGWDKAMLLIVGIFVISLGIVVRRKGERLYKTPLHSGDQQARSAGVPE